MYKIGINIQQHNSASIQGAYIHNERRSESHDNIHIKKERTPDNYYWIKPADTYTALYDDLLKRNVISEKGLKETSTRIETAVIDIKAKYFDNDYQKAVEVYSKPVEAFIDKVGKDFVLSAVMHADEVFTDTKTGEELVHYHVHIAYIPTVKKSKRWSRATAKKDPSLYERDEEGNIIYVEEYNRKTKKTERLPLTKIKEEYTQVSHSNFYKNRFPGDTKTYSRLQDFIADQVREYDLFRGNERATEDELTTNEYTAKEQRRKRHELHMEVRELKNEKVEIEEAIEKTIEEARAEIKSLAPKEGIEEPPQKDLEFIAWCIKHINGVFKRVLDLCNKLYLDYIKRRKMANMAAEKGLESLDDRIARIKQQNTEETPSECREKSPQGERKGR